MGGALRREAVAQARPAGARPRSATVLVQDVPRGGSSGPREFGSARGGRGSRACVKRRPAGAGRGGGMAAGFGRAAGARPPDGAGQRSCRLLRGCWFWCRSVLTNVLKLDRASAGPPRRGQGDGERATQGCPPPVRRRRSRAAAKPSGLARSWPTAPACGPGSPRRWREPGRSSAAPARRLGAAAAPPPGRGGGERRAHLPHGARCRHGGTQQSAHTSQVQQPASRQHRHLVAEGLHQRWAELQQAGATPSAARRERLSGWAWCTPGALGRWSFSARTCCPRRARAQRVVQFGSGAGSRTLARKQGRRHSSPEPKQQGPRQAEHAPQRGSRAALALLSCELLVRQALQTEAGCCGCSVAADLNAANPRSQTQPSGLGAARGGHGRTGAERATANACTVKRKMHALDAQLCIEAVVSMQYLDPAQSGGPA